MGQAGGGGTECHAYHVVVGKGLVTEGGTWWDFKLDQGIPQCWQGRWGHGTASLMMDTLNHMSKRTHQQQRRVSGY